MSTQDYASAVPKVVIFVLKHLRSLANGLLSERLLGERSVHMNSNVHKSTTFNQHASQLPLKGGLLALPFYLTAAQGGQQSGMAMHWQTTHQLM